MCILYWQILQEFTYLSEFWLYNKEGKVKYRKKILFEFCTIQNGVCFYTYFSHYILGKEGLSLAFSNQILKCMDKYTNIHSYGSGKYFPWNQWYTNNWARVFFLNLYRRNILLEYIFFLIVWYSGCVVGNFSSIPSFDVYHPIFG